MNLDIVTTADIEKLKNDLLASIEVMLNKRSEPPKKWLRSGEMKKLFGLSAGTLQTCRINGTLKYSKIGGIFYYDYDHVLKLLEENYGGSEYQVRKGREMKEVYGKRATHLRASK